jgi:protocatechuate 3,4-dioxygenase beta subunit
VTRPPTVHNGLSELTEEVVASFAGAASPRYRDVMVSLVRHLHAFIDDVSLTEAEWRYAIDFLTRTGHLSDDRRQEFVLLSDVLGASMATVAVNHPVGPGDITESTVLGPFFVDGAPLVELGGDISAGAAGPPCHVSGSVHGAGGEPVPGARLEIWEADEDGFYDVQRPDGQVQNRGHLFADDQGGYRFWSVRPAPYPIPDDGPVGELLTAAGRGPMRPAHIHFQVSAPGYRTLTTHIFVDGGQYLHSDAVFGVKESLIRSFVDCPPGTAPDGRRIDVPWTRVAFDIVLGHAAPDDGRDRVGQVSPVCRPLGGDRPDSLG